MSRQSSNSNAGRNLVFILVAVAVLIGGAFAVAAFTLSADDPTIHPSVSSTSTTQPEAAPTIGINLPLVQMQGTWTAQENSGHFLATIKNKTITVEFGSETTTMVYWYGTFGPTQESPGATISSDAIDTNTLVLSADKTKDFELRDDVLWFKFSAMGMTKKIGLQRV